MAGFLAQLEYALHALSTTKSAPGQHDTQRYVINSLANSLLVSFPSFADRKMAWQLLNFIVAGHSLLQQSVDLAQVPCKPHSQPY